VNPDARSPVRFELAIGPTTSQVDDGVGAANGPTVLNEPNECHEFYAEYQRSFVSAAAYLSILTRRLAENFLALAACQRVPARSV